MLNHTYQLTAFAPSICRPTGSFFSSVCYHTHMRPPIFEPQPALKFFHPVADLLDQVFSIVNTSAFFSIVFNPAQTQPDVKQSTAFWRP